MKGLAQAIDVVKARLLGREREMRQPHASLRKSTSSSSSRCSGLSLSFLQAASLPTRSAECMTIALPNLAKSSLEQRCDIIDKLGKCRITENCICKWQVQEHQARGLVTVLHCWFDRYSKEGKLDVFVKPPKEKAADANDIGRSMWAGLVDVGGSSLLEIASMVWSEARSCLSEISPSLLSLTVISSNF